VSARVFVCVFLQVLLPISASKMADLVGGE